MHICFVCNEYPPAPHGGIGSFTQTLGRALVKAGQRVTAIGAYPDQYAGTESDEGVHVIRLSRKGPPLARFLLNRLVMTRTLREVDSAKRIDIVEGGELELCSLNRTAPGIKILRMHGGPNYLALNGRPQLVKNFKERWAFHVADHLCAVSHSVADGTRRLMKLEDRPIEVIPNPIDTALFAPDPAVEEEKGLIVFVGTVTELKGIRELMKAMPRIIAQVPEARLEVYGGDTVCPVNRVSLTRTLQAALTPEVAARIEWKGRMPRERMPEALQRASICVYPSHIESMPLAWLEGMACGKAIAASRTGPGPEIIDDGVTGLLCDPFDPESIAAKIVTLLKDVPLRRRLGEAARRTALERYSLAPLVERNLDYYERIARRAL